uniref:centrosomal protein CEP57L1 isoform X2 n=1 Tax=Jaculus jaculus TaxID=51337 RepID=UPI001E1B3241|nr:centrosomal protein CEP57L1 isoform X2 [Jaculus jaculus]
MMDSEFIHSIVGSYLKPPERVFVPSLTQNESPQYHHPVNFQATAPKMVNSPNSQALVLALRTLQEKIHRLELERTQAEDNLSILSREAAQYKKALENETNERNLAHQELIKQKKEKQLEYTKRMVLNVEREKNMILEQQAQLQREKEQDQMKLHAKLEKLDVLEKECFRLTTTQQTAEEKIKYLEEKLKEEEHQRKLFQDKASELQTGLEISKILMSSVSNSKHSKEKKKSSKKSKCIKGRPPQQIESKLSTPSFKCEKLNSSDCSVSASLQNLLQLMPRCGPQSFPKPALALEPRCLHKPPRTASGCRTASCSSEKPIVIFDNLSELLMAMQDELNQMSLEHNKLLTQREQTESRAVCDDIEWELEQLVKRMEIKGEQISKLKKHQNSVRKLQQKFQNSWKSEPSSTLQDDTNPKGSKCMKNSPRKYLSETNPFPKRSNFHPIQVHNLQMKLRRDDIMWEQ